MKLLVTTILFFSTFASAEVKPRGTFVPSDCSTDKQYSDWQMCFGTKVGFEGEYIQASYRRRLPVLYKIISEKIAPTTNKMYSNHDLTIRDAQGKRGHILVKYHKGAERIVWAGGELPGEVKIAVKNFVRVSVSQ